MLRRPRETWRKENRNETTHLLTQSQQSLSAGGDLTRGKDGSGETFVEVYNISYVKMTVLYLGVGSPPDPTRPLYLPGKLKQTSNPGIL